LFFLFTSSPLPCEFFGFERARCVAFALF